MADIELAIKIPNEMYQKVLDGTYCGTLYEELKHGVLIPKGHGRLIDADVLVDGMEDDYDFCEVVNATPTIIESDKESEDA